MTSFRWAKINRNNSGRCWSPPDRRDCRPFNEKDRNYCVVVHGVVIERLCRSATKSATSKSTKLAARRKSQRGRTCEQSSGRATHADAGGALFFLRETAAARW